MKIKAKQLLQIVVALLVLSALPACNQHPTIPSQQVENDIVGQRLLGPKFLWGNWNIEPSDSRKLNVLETKYNGDNAAVVINLDTSGSRNGGYMYKMAGKLRLHYEWIANQWTFRRIEDIDFKQIEPQR